MVGIGISLGIGSGGGGGGGGIATPPPLAPGASGAVAQLRTSIKGSLTWSKLSGASSIAIAGSGVVTLSSALAGGTSVSAVVRVQNTIGDAAERSVTFRATAAPALPSPLRIATTNLRGPGARLSPASGGRTVHQQRTRHFVGGKRLTAVTVAFFTYRAIDTEIDSTPFTVDKVALEINGAALPLTKNGQRSAIIEPAGADADGLIIFDELPVSILYGAEIACRIQTRTDAYWPHTNSGTISALTTGAGGFEGFNSYVATDANTIDQIDGTGPLTPLTGASANYLSLPFILLGRFEGDEHHSVVVYGDSIGEGLDSGNYAGNGMAVPSVAGGGYVHMAQVDAKGAIPIAMLNFSRAGAVLGADGATGFAPGFGTKRLGLQKYAKVSYLPLGINDLSTGPAGRTVEEMLIPLRRHWQNAKAAGCKVLQPLYTPRTSPATFPITSMSSTGTVATAVLGVPLANTGLAVGGAITIAGSTPTGYNGAKTITAVDAAAGTISFTVTSGLAAASGTLTLQYTNALTNARSQTQYLYGSETRIALNAHFLASVGTEIDAVARVDLTVGHPEDATKWSTDPVYCSTGRLHPNLAGHAVMATTFRQAILSVSPVW